MTWNFRVVRESTEGFPWYSIREVYYDRHGKVGDWTEKPVAPLGESLDELRADLARMAEALNHPTLEETKSVDLREVSDD